MLTYSTTTEQRLGALREEAPRSRIHWWQSWRKAMAFAPPPESLTRPGTWTLPLPPAMCAFISPDSKSMRTFIDCHQTRCWYNVCARAAGCWLMAALQRDLLSPSHLPRWQLHADQQSNSKPPTSPSSLRDWDSLLSKIIYLCGTSLPPSTAGAYGDRTQLLIATLKRNAWR